MDNEVKSPESGNGEPEQDPHVDTIILKYHKDTNALEMYGPMHDPIVFVGMLQLALQQYTILALEQQHKPDDTIIIPSPRLPRDFDKV